MIKTILKYNCVTHYEDGFVIIEMSTFLNNGNVHDRSITLNEEEYQEWRESQGYKEETRLNKLSDINSRKNFVSIVRDEYLSQKYQDEGIPGNS